MKHRAIVDLRAMMLLLIIGGRDCKLPPNLLQTNHIGIDVGNFIKKQQQAAMQLPEANEGHQVQLDGLRELYAREVLLTEEQQSQLERWDFH